jgi:hypothetical protein
MARSGDQPQADGGALRFRHVNLGLGLARFVTGARLVPVAVAAQLGVTETLLGPHWGGFFGRSCGPNPCWGVVLAAR